MPTTEKVALLLPGVWEEVDANDGERLAEVHFDDEGYWWMIVDQSCWVAKADAAWRGREKGGRWKVAAHEAGPEIRMRISRIEGTPASDWVAENLGGVPTQALGALKQVGLLVQRLGAPQLRYYVTSASRNRLRAAKHDWINDNDWGGSDRITGVKWRRLD